MVFLHSNKNSSSDRDYIPYLKFIYKLYFPCIYDSFIKMATYIVSHTFFWLLQMILMCFYYKALVNTDQSFKFKYAYVVIVKSHEMNKILVLIH